jgi:hypothetical protein
MHILFIVLSFGNVLETASSYDCEEPNMLNIIKSKNNVKIIVANVNNISSFLLK